MATKKAPAKKAAAPAKKAAPGKAAGKPATSKTPIIAKPTAPKMTKTQVLGHMAERMGVRPREVAALFDLLIETATRQTREAGEFTVPGLGKLVKAERAARTGRNPATGEPIQIPAKPRSSSGFPNPPRMPSCRLSSSRRHAAALAGR